MSLSGSSFSTTGNDKREGTRGLFSSSASSQGSALEIKTLKATTELKLGNAKDTERPYLLGFIAANTVSETRTNTESSTGLISGHIENTTLRETQAIPSAGFGLGFEKRNDQTTWGIEGIYTGFEKKSLLTGGYTLSLTVKF